MLRAEVFVFQPGHLTLRSIEDSHGFAAKVRLGVAAVQPWHLLQTLAQSVFHIARNGSDLFQKRTGYTIGLFEKGEQQVLIGNLRMVEFPGVFLRGLHGLLHFLGEAVESHIGKSAANPSR